MSGIIELLSQEEIEIPVRFSGSGVSVRRVPAHVYGYWAVHRRQNSKTEWTVTHIPSGFCIPRYCDSFDDACEMMEFVSTLANDFDRLANDREFWEDFGVKFRERYAPDTGTGVYAPDSYAHRRMNSNLIDREVQS